MSIFDLHSTVHADYRDFVWSFFTVVDGRARRGLHRADFSLFTGEKLLILSF